MRSSPSAAALAVLCAALTVPARPGAAAPVPPPGSFASANVEWLATLPETGAISAHFVTDRTGHATYMYLSTVRGLAIYDVSNPAVPLPLGRLALPSYENEDVDGNADRAIVSTSPGGQIFVVDTTNKLAPRLDHLQVAEDGDAHTSSCLDDCGRWFYATEGQDLKLVDVTNQEPIEAIPYGPVGPVHDVEQDADGIVWMSGDTGVAGFAVAPLRRGSPALRLRTRTATPANPVKITDMVVNKRNLGRDERVNRNILHNAARPTTATYRQTRGKPRIDRGGVLFVTEELRLDQDALADGQFGACQNAGRFHAFDASGAVSTGAPLRLLDTFSLEEGTLAPWQGQKQQADAFCGAHWFDVADDVVALAMYGAGTRFLDVSNPRDIRQVGWFVSVDQEAWSAYWVPGSDGIVYSIDLERGVDVLRYSPPAQGTSVLAPAPPPRQRVGWLRPRAGTPYAFACPVVVPGIRRFR